MKQHKPRLSYRFADYVMRGRKQAIVAALLVGMIPFMGWLGIVVVGLVTLRQGMRDGFQVLLWAILPSVVIGVLYNKQLLVESVLFGYVLTWGLACVLNSTASWVRVIEIAAAIGIAAVVVMHLWVGDTHQFWMAYLTSNYKQISQIISLPLSVNDLKPIITNAAKVLTGTQAVMVLGSALINVAIARWLQGLLYNPGGLRQELYGIRMNMIASLLLLIVGATAWLGIPLAMDVLPVALLPFAVAGLSLVHRVASNRKSPTTWLISVYVLLMLFPPNILLLIVGAAVIDSYMNIRQKYALAQP